jgi:superfamily II DNA/RNA helicase
VSSPTPHQAKYYAHELTCRHSADSVDRLSQSLFDASVDLNPHQIDAALFALSNPMQQGVLLADEVGLGKTIEAALVLCQYWAERRRKLIIVCPASLRKQWSQELADKFALPSVVMDASAVKKSGYTDHGYLSQLAGKTIIIMSYPYAAKLADTLVGFNWDLLVIDEAHKLRNAHRTSNRMGQALKRGFNGTRKLLLSATPLQNSLMELYGLSTLLDEHLFGDEASFRKQYMTTGADMDALRQRLSSFSKRTLRRQVLEYVKYTERRAMTQPFNPTDDEHQLYESISAFLQREHSFALPKRQRHLTGLILRKLLASSAHAIIGTLTVIKDRLERKLKGLEDDPEFMAKLIEADDMDTDLIDELETEDESVESELINLNELKAEIAEIEHFIEFASALTSDSKAQSLLTALQQGFAKMQELGGAQKAIIFTESRRTQEYLVNFLSANGYQDKLVAFSGTNSGEQATAIYQQWLTQYKGTDKVTGSPQVDRRTALIDCFRDSANIMIATEAAAEGVNLQFCSLIINYDLPWNPQRVEQRIGRCHRYGQKFDVVVMNFLNTRNQADQRVLELLTQKFNLFSGVFGASDEVLGRIESGIDFEKRIADIYDTCRTPDSIEQAFNALQKELESDIENKLKQTQSQLLEHFDEDVHQRLKIQLDEAEARLDKISRWFWETTKFSLSQYAQFDLNQYAFSLAKSPISSALAGRYQLVKGGVSKQTDAFAHAYRLTHPLGEWVVETAKHADTPIAELTFDYTHHPLKLSVIAELVGKAGWLRLDLLTVTALEPIETLIFTACTDDGQWLDQDVCEKLMSVAVNGNKNCKQAEPISLQDNSQRAIQAKIAGFVEDNNKLFQAERDKLERWAEDKILASEEALKDTKAKLAQLKRDSRKALTLEEQSALQKQISDTEKLQRRLRQEIFNVEDEIIEKRDGLIADLETRLRQTTTTECLFAIRWQVV